MSLWRQGDVLIKAVKSIPKNSRTRSGAVLVRGEATGHSHRLQNKDVGELFEADNKLYLRVLADEAVIVHEEHGPVHLPKGEYEIWQQREYSPAAIRTIRD